MTAFLMIFRRFPTTFRRFSKIFQNCSEGQTNVPEHFPRISENFQRCPKIAEDFRGRPEDDTATDLSIFKRQTKEKGGNRDVIERYDTHIRLHVPCLALQP